jgi:hypothetical protein
LQNFKPRWLVFALTSSWLAWGCGGASSAADVELPKFVNIQFRQALIGPTKVDGAAWDGVGRLDLSSQGLLGSALAAANPHAQVAQFLANPTLAALEKPDPRARVRAFAGPRPLQSLSLKSEQDNTLTPIWREARLERLALAPNLRIELELYDSDLIGDDAMGAGTITRADVIAALRAGTVHPIRFAEQTHKQVLFVDISVQASP